MPLEPKHTSVFKLEKKKLWAFILCVFLFFYLLALVIAFPQLKDAGGTRFSCRFSKPGWRGEQKNVLQRPNI